MKRLIAIADNNITNIPKELGTVITTYKGKDTNAAISYDNDNMYYFDIDNPQDAQSFPLTQDTLKTFEDAEEQVLEYIMKDDESITRKILNTRLVNPDQSNIWNSYKKVPTEKNKGEQNHRQQKYYKDNNGDYLNDDQTIIQVIIKKEFEKDIKAFLRDAGINDYLKTYSIVPMTQEVFDKVINKNAYIKYKRKISNSRLKRLLLAYDYDSVINTMTYKIVDDFLINVGDNVVAIYFDNDTNNANDASGAGFILAYNNIYIAFDKNVESELSVMEQNMIADKKRNIVYMFDEFMQALNDDKLQHVKQFGYFEVAEMWILNQAGNSIKSRKLMPGYEALNDNDNTWKNYIEKLNMPENEEENKENAFKPEDFMVVRIHLIDNNKNISYFKQQLEGQYRDMIYSITYNDPSLE